MDIFLISVHIFNMLGVPFINDLIQEIEYSISTGDPVLSSCEILNPRDLPDTDVKLSDYGEVWSYICLTQITTPLTPCRTVAVMRGTGWFLFHLKDRLIRSPLLTHWIYSNPDPHRYPCTHYTNLFQSICIKTNFPLVQFAVINVVKYTKDGNISTDIKQQSTILECEQCHKGIFGKSLLKSHMLTYYGVREASICFSFERNSKPSGTSVYYM
jgi:hypothetical protein